MDQFERDYVSERSAQNRPRDDSISLENLPPPSFVLFANYVQRPLAVFTGSLMDSSAGSTVGGTGWGQTIINSAVPGAYYAGQAELAFRDGRYLLGTAHSVASVLEAGIGVFTLGRSTAALGAVRAIGFVPGTAEVAFSAMRGGGGHAIRHLQGTLIPNTGSLASRVDAFKALAVPILENPVHTADWRIGATLGRAFVGKVNGTDLVVVVAKEGPYQGQVISSFVPDANQLSLILAR
jgi:hypothetical protein